MEIKGQIYVEREEGKTRLRERYGNSAIHEKNSTHNAVDKRKKVTVSGKARGIYQCFETRAERIDAIKKAIDAGNYNINVMDVAKKVLDEI